jgi:RNA recognition motif-containing protein
MSENESDPTVAESKIESEEEPKYSYDYEPQQTPAQGSTSGGQYGHYGRQANEEEDLAGKLFLGGLSWQTTKEGLKFYFERIGELKDANVFSDKVLFNLIRSFREKKNFFPIKNIIIKFRKLGSRKDLGSLHLRILQV